MADIRINSLPTTASASSSDDFLALDGATNGTRKLNAYSPTFGGNLTVSGTTGSTFGQIARTNGTNATVLTLSDNLTGVSTAGFGLQIRGTSNNGGCVSAIGFENGGTGTNNETQFSVYTQNAANALTKQFTIGSTGNATLTGNLTVSGTGTHSFNGPVSITGTTASNILRLTKSGAGSKTFGIDNALDFRIYADNGSTQLFKLTDSGDTTITGNLTVSGGTITGGTSGLSLASGGTNQNITLTPSGTGATVISKAETNTNAITTALNYIKIQNTSSGGTYIGALEFYTWDNRRAAGIFANRNNVDGTSGILSFAYSTSVNSFAEGFRLNSTGNFLIGTAIDGGQKLQVAGTVYFSGDLYSNTAGSTWGADSGATGFLVYGAGGGANANKLVLRTNSSTALTLDSSQNATFAGMVTTTGNVSASKAVVGGSVVLSARNTDNTNSVSAAVAQLTVGGASAGDPRLLFTIDAVQDWSVGVDNSDGDKFKIGPSSAVGTSTSLTLDPTTGNATFAGSIAIGNTVQTAASVASTHKVTIVIGGVTYYLLATNV